MTALLLAFALVALPATPMSPADAAAAPAQPPGEASAEGEEPSGPSAAAEQAETEPPAAEQAETEPPAAPAGPRNEAVEYSNGPLALAAELMLPAAEGPVPGAVILQGSGASDRSNPWARAIAEELMGQGLAVLLTDKRGSGQSEGDWRQAGFGDLAGDALAGLQYLQERPEVDAERVGLVGLSQGGWVAPIAAAARPREVAFVIDISGAAVSFAEQTTVEMANTSRQAGLDEEAVERILELNRLAALYLMSGDWEPYGRALEQAQETAWGEIATGFPASPDAPIWSFLRRAASFDPMPYWIQVRQPVLVLYGAEDEADNVPVAESVRRLEFAFAAAGKENYRIVVVPGAGHAFIDAETGALMPAFTEALGAWVEESIEP